MNSILIIGTQPPCPRCRLLTELVIKESELIGLDAEIRHIAYTSEEAEDIARAVRLLPGTAKDVSKKVGIEINWSNDSITPEDGAQIKNLNPGLKEFEQLFKEVAILDNRLRYFENIAKETGYMMTPVLIINGEIKHQGSLPKISDVERWLSELI